MYSVMPSFTRYPEKRLPRRSRGGAAAGLEARRGGVAAGDEGLHRPTRGQHRPPETKSAVATGDDPVQSRHRPDERETVRRLAGDPAPSRAPHLKSERGFIPRERPHLNSERGFIPRERKTDGGGGEVAEDEVFEALVSRPPRHRAAEMRHPHAGGRGPPRDLASAGAGRARQRHGRLLVGADPLRRQRCHPTLEERYEARRVRLESDERRRRLEALSFRRRRDPGGARFESHRRAVLAENRAFTLGGRCQRRHQPPRIELGIFGAPVGAGEPADAEARLEHVMVEELAGKAVFAQRVLALGQRLGFGAILGDEEAAPALVAAVVAEHGQQLPQAVVVLALDLPRFPRRWPPPAAHGLDVQEPGPGRNVAEVERRRAAADSRGFQDQGPAPAARQLPGGEAAGEPGPEDDDIGALSHTEAAFVGASRTAAAIASSRGVRGRWRRGLKGAASETSSQIRQSSSSVPMPRKPPAAAARSASSTLTSRIRKFAFRPCARAAAAVRSRKHWKLTGSGPTRSRTRGGGATPGGGSCAAASAAAAASPTKAGCIR